MGLASGLAELKDQVAYLEETNAQLQTRIQTLEADAGIAPRPFGPDSGLLIFTLDEKETND